MAFGLPYKGSKNAIARKIVDFLPAGGVLYDLFCGGCAITHAGILSGKWDGFVINDINPDLPKIFNDAIHGRINGREWISREDFQRRKEETLVALIWSFGNDLGKRPYLYGKHIEPWKKAVFYARVLGDRSFLKQMGIDSDGSREDIKAHADEYKRKYIDWFNSLESLQRLESLQSLERLQRIERLESLERLQRIESLQRLERLEFASGDYQDVKLDREGIIYCDIPYKGTSKYGDQEFDYERFYAWCERQELPVFVSEYWMPEDRFVCVKEIDRIQRISAVDNSTWVKERIFIPKRQESRFRDSHSKEWLF